MEYTENLYEEVMNLREQVNSMSATIEMLQKQAELFNLHFAKMYAAKTIEETLDIMGDLGKQTIGAEECKIYSVDPYDKSKIFTVDESLNRKYLTAEENTMLQKAITNKTQIIENKVAAEMLGDGMVNIDVANALVMPIEDHCGDVIGVVVAKDKKGGFYKEDAKTFDLQQGQLGMAFRMGLENKALLQTATVDELTKLSNRKGMNHFIETTVLSRAQKREPVSAILFDIDFFKKFNDTYGHDVGDKCLKQVADIFKNNLRLSSDNGVFRWGGEEMVVILPVGEKEAFSIAERLRHAVEETPLRISDKETAKITVSGGIASFAPVNAYDLTRNNILERFEKECFESADKALYNAKGNGRNRTYGSSKLMETCRSMPSPTQMFKDYLERLQIPLVQHKDGFELSDNLIEQKRLQTPKEAVESLAQYTASNLLPILRAKLDSYELIERINIDGSQDIVTLNDWDNFAKQNAEGKYAEFVKENSKNFAFVDLLANHADEIKLDLIAEKSLDMVEEKAQPKRKSNKEIEKE